MSFFGIDAPFIKLCGFTAHARTETEFVATLEPRPELMNARGVIHGGVICTFLDITLGVAAGAFSRTTSIPVTVDLNTLFLAPATGALTCKARLLRSSRRLAFCEGEVFTRDGACAKGVGTYRVTAPDAPDADIRMRRDK